MVKVGVYNTQAEQIGEIELNEAIFGVEINETLVHEVVVNQLANLRQGTKSTLTRAEVRGGGRKPWKQKGTGRARQGSIRSPQWKGGGIVFAPKPRDFSYTLNKKEKRLALKSALTSRVLQNKLIVISEIKMDSIRTKEMQIILNNFKIKKAVLVLDDGDDKHTRNVILSARNIPGIKTSGVNTLNVYDIMKYDNFIVTRRAIENMQEVYA
ncbi:MAG TPA: 50S ribosomal protein L4 [Clostridiales bacterium]|nr:MAG: 50S ribosomal protein L4 [Clostridiales bacterium GWD2_32_59]HAN09219.1 50S ribosomal protein L4 [Clostridiales bacterium]